METKPLTPEQQAELAKAILEERAASRTPGEALGAIDRARKRLGLGSSQSDPVGEPG